MPDQSDREQRAKRYNRTHLWFSIGETIAGFCLLFLFLVSGGSHWLARAIRTWASSPIMIVGLYFIILVLAAEVLDLPLSYLSGYWLEHKYQLSTQSLRAWLLDQLKGWGIELALGLLLVELVYYLLRGFPHAWWWIAGIAFGLIFILLVNLAPVLLMPLFFKFTPLADEELKNRLLKLAAKSHTRIKGVYEMDLSKKSKKANAGLTGLGNTRRIIVADNMLRDYDYNEIEVVLAHELGHHAHHHLGQGIIQQMAITFISLYVIDWTLKAGASYFKFQGIADIAGLPLLMLVAMLVSLLALPLNNFISRKLEYQADDYALGLTQKHSSFISLMEKLARQNLAEFAPHPLVEAIFYSHPSVSKRIKNCQAYLC